MAIDSTWDDTSIKNALGALDEDAMKDEIKRIQDQDVIYKCLDLMDLTWGDVFGMINFSAEDSPATQGPLNYGQETVAGNGLYDGRYVFQVDQGVAYVYREWNDIGEQPIATFPVPDLPDGALGIAESQATEWTEYSMISADETAAFYGNRAFRDKQQDLQQATSTFENRLANLVKESGSRMTFRATSEYLIDGATFGELWHLMDPVAIHGTIEFTRHHTRPNVFSISGLTRKTPPAGYDTNLTGLGGDEAMARLQQAIRSFAKTPQYPYKDGSRIKIDIAE